MRIPEDVGWDVSGLGLGDLTHEKSGQCQRPQRGGVLRSAFCMAGRFWDG